jgi:dienelactone hydrolase
MDNDDRSPEPAGIALFRTQRRVGLCRVTAAFAALLVATGCFTSHVRTPYTDAGDAQESQSFEAAPPFRYSKTDVPFTNHVDGTGALPTYELRLIEMPSIGDSGQPDNLVTAKYYRSTLPGSHPLVIVLPIWGTFTYPPRKISSSVQRQSNGAVHVLYVQGDNYLADWSGIAAATDESKFFELWHQAVERQRVTIVDVRRLIDWAERRPEIDPDRIGLIGFSLGAVVAGTIATQESRLAATVSVMGGSHLHSIIATCDGKRATRVQTRAAESFGWDREELEARLEPITSVLDPANYPDRVDPRRVLIIEANRDLCVPESAREDLWLALGKPERISMNYDHAPAFYSFTPLGFNWMRRRIWDFLEARLLE